MKKSTQVFLITIGLLDIIASAAVAGLFMTGKEIALTVVPGMIAFNFFMYKLLAGWLLVNMTVKVEGTRQAVSGDLQTDHLSLKVTLNKGSIDSVWIDKIEIRLREMRNGTSADFFVVPLNIEKLGDTDLDYWAGTKSDFYTISSGEEACFAAYTTVPANVVVSAELLVLGTRLFYGIESSLDKRIQWRSSAVILPCKSKS